MDKLDMESKKIVSDNISKIAELFPNVVKEDANKLSIDFEALKQELSELVIDDKKEKYELTWSGKKDAIVLANTPTTNILRPLKEKSLNFNNTDNVYIEGDNLEALKILQESYLGKIKCIYIDPPYNRGSDLIYKDNYHRSKEEELLESGQIDEDGNKLISNINGTGKFHSSWLSMMYSRLKVARNLLSDNGVIFISIDDNEMVNLKKICDEIFGEANFVNCIAVKMSEASGVKMSHANKRFPKIKEYILFYKKNSFEKFVTIDKYRSDEWDKENNIYLENFSIDDRKKLQDIENKEYITKEDVIIVQDILKNVKKCPLSSVLSNLKLDNDNEKNEWLFDNSYRIIKTAGSSSLLNLVKKNGYRKDQEISADVSSDNILFYYLTDFNEDAKQPRLQVIFSDTNLYKNPCDFWQDIKTTGGIANEGEVPYNNGKKPLKLLERIISMVTTEDDIIMDFFSGSSSTAHAVMDLNLKEDMKRKFIMVQIDENLDESYKSATGENKKAIKEMIDYLDSIGKPHILCELGEERIRKSGKKLLENSSKIIDTGFRVFKIDSSNMKDDFYKTPGELEQSQLKLFETNIKEDRSADDLLVGVILDLGLTLDYKVEEKSVKENKVYFVNDNELVACFDESVDIDIIDEISKIEPLMAVFRDDSFKTDSDKINLEERFKKLSPNTKISIL